MRIDLVMDLEIVIVGNELLLGFTNDTNIGEVARALIPVGARVVRCTTVGDNRTDIRQAVGAALDRTGFVVVSGGLGPTSDDITRESVAEELGLALTVDRAVLEDIEARFARYRPGPMPPSNRKQAEVPAGADVLANAHGSAPGLWIPSDRGTAVLLPGVPREFRALTAEHLVPRLRAMAVDGSVITTKTLRTTGISESALADDLADVLGTIRGVEIAFLPTLEGVDLRITAHGARADSRRSIESAEAQLRPVLGRHCYATGEGDLAAVVLERLRSLGARLAVAESCTGGLIGARLTEIPGASSVFLGGMVTYADETKVRDLGVDPAILARDGAVSEATVRAMVAGVSDRFGARAAIAVTGIAGPHGGTEDKPVGTVCFAAMWEGAVESMKRHIPGSRYDVRRRAAQAAMDLLRRMLPE